MDEDLVGEGRYMLVKANDRLGFIRKVYTILSCQMMITTLFVTMTVTIQPLKETVQELWPVAIVAMLFSFILLIAILCFQRLAKTVPTNYILLVAFTLCEAYIVGFLCAFYEPMIVLAAAIMTLGITLALTVYACITRTDFTTCMGIMHVLVVSLLLFGLLMIFMYNSALYLLFCYFAVVVYGIFIVYDTQLIVGGRYRELGYDDYILGALILYIDVIGLFIYLLRILGRR